jgi:superfamily II DNA or RNA helicase
MKLYDYQEHLLAQIDHRLKLCDKLCCQLATGGGKTVIFSQLAKNNLGQTLILVDSQELVFQTARNFTNAGTFEAKNKTMPSTQIVIAMAQTIWSRLKKDPQMIERFNLCIVDECHEWGSNKLFPFLKDCKIVGFTATPVRLKRHTFIAENGTEWTREETMSEVYDDIVCGISIKELIDRNFLVDEEPMIIPINNSKLVTDSSGEFTNQSIENALDNSEYRIDILANYEKLCKGKKTLIFSSSTKVNLAIYELFKENGYENIRYYDSQNVQESTRKEIVDWYRNTPEAILFNVSVFTKGFDVKDVEAIILARPTASLAKFIQIAGRGSRTTDENQIYKDRFVFIDGGGNIARLGLWSAERDWERIFYKGLNPPKAKKEALEDVKECKGCGFIMAKCEIICPECGNEEEVKPKKELEIIKDAVIAVPIKPIYPDAKKIIKYCERIKKDKFFAFNILNNQVFDLFINYNVDKEQFIRNLGNGTQRIFEQNLKRNHAIIVNSNLPYEAHRSYKRQCELLLNKLKKYYGIL